MQNLSVVFRLLTPVTLGKIELLFLSFMRYARTRSWLHVIHESARDASSRVLMMLTKLLPILPDRYDAVVDEYAH